MKSYIRVRDSESPFKVYVVLTLVIRKEVHSLQHKAPNFGSDDDSTGNWSHTSSGQTLPRQLQTTPSVQ